MSLHRGWFERISIAIVALPIGLGAAWLPSWSVAVSCTRALATEVHCVTNNRGLFAGGSAELAVREPRAARALTTAAKTKRGSSGRAVVFDTPLGEVPLYVASLNLASEGDWKQLAAELDQLARGSKQSVSSDVGLSGTAIGFSLVVMLLMGLVVWIQGLSILLEFDATARTLTVTERHYGIRTSQRRIGFDALTGVSTKRQRRTTALALTTQGGSVELLATGHARAASYAATLERALARFNPSPST